MQRPKRHFGDAFLLLRAKGDKNLCVCANTCRFMLSWRIHHRGVVHEVN